MASAFIKVFSLAYHAHLSYGPVFSTSNIIRKCFFNENSFFSTSSQNKISKLYYIIVQKIIFVNALVAQLDRVTASGAVNGCSNQPEGIIL